MATQKLQLLRHVGGQVILSPNKLHVAKSTSIDKDGVNGRNVASIFPFLVSSEGCRTIPLNTVPLDEGVNQIAILKCGCQSGISMRDKLCVSCTNHRDGPKLGCNQKNLKQNITWLACSWLSHSNLQKNHRHRKQVHTDPVRMQSNWHILLGRNLNQIFISWLIKKSEGKS